MKKILLDVDGVAADFVGGLERALQRKFTKEELSHHDFIDKLPWATRSEVYKVLAEPDFWLGLHEIPGASKGVEMWDRAGHIIVWVTSPWVSCHSWEHARRRWLEKHFGIGELGHHYVPTSSKELIDGDEFIDDKLSNVEKWAKAHPQKRAWLFDAPYNQEPKNPSQRRFDWSKADQVL